MDDLLSFILLFLKSFHVTSWDRCARFPNSSAPCLGGKSRHVVDVLLPAVQQLDVLVVVGVFVCVWARVCVMCACVCVHCFDFDLL